MYENFFEYFGSYAGISALVILLTQVVCNFFKITGKTKQYVSWIISVLVVAVAILFGVYGGFGVFVGWQVNQLIDWACAISVAIGCGLCANGLYDWEVIKSVLKWLGFDKKKKLESEDRIY